MDKKTLIIGLTGGIACGKSGISKLFNELEVAIIDTDIVSRQVVEIGSPVLLSLKQCFGSQILNDKGELNRALMREIAFSNNDNLEKLNQIMLPAILAETKRQISMLNSPYVIVVIPLLIEHNLQDFVDRILVVDVNEEIQLKRLLRRDGISLDLAKKMIASQCTREKRLSFAQDLIESDESPLDKKRPIVLKLHKKYLEIAEQQK